MKSWLMVVVCLLVALLAADAEARGRRGGGGGGYAVSTADTFAGMKVAIEPALQAVAQARAEVLAERNSIDHNVHTYTKAPNWNAAPGLSGEGLGIGGSPNCATCILGNTVVADAHCRCRNGQCVRVRIFRNR